MWSRFAFTALFSVIFIVSVTCAVVCPEQALDNQHQDRECTECISTHFVAGDKTSNEPAGLDVLGPQNPVLSPTPSVPLVLGFLTDLSDTSRHLSPQSTITIFRI
jgi:hypothetical protein